MPLIKPVELKKIDVQDVEKVLHENGALIDPASVSETLNSLGGSVSDACETIVDLMKNSQYDNVKHRTAIDVLKLHGVMKGDEAVNDNRIQIVIHSPDKSVGDIFCPQRNVQMGNVQVKTIEESIKRVN